MGDSLLYEPPLIRMGSRYEREKFGKILSQERHNGQELVHFEYPRFPYPIYYLLFSIKFNLFSISEIRAHGNELGEYSNGVSRRDSPSGRQG